jgi:hypothetical protein
MLLLMINIPFFLMGQLNSVDSVSNNFVPNDSAVPENILKTPELQIEATSESVSPSAPIIPMNIPGIRQSDFMTPPRYLGYEDAKNMFKYTAPKFNAGKPNLNLNLPPPKSILDLIGENPLRALIYGTATLAGMANHTVMGEDKMNKIRLNEMVQSRSGIPETAISGQGTVYYEIEIKRNR